MDSLTQLISNFDPSKHDSDLGDHLKHIKSYLAGRKLEQASQKRNFGPELGQGWDHLRSLLQYSYNQEDKLSILDMLWDVIKIKDTASNLKQQLNISKMMYFVLSSIVQLQCYAQGQDKAWELYWKVVGVTGGAQDHVLMAPNSNDGDWIKTDKTATLIFGVVVCLVTVLGKVGKSADVLHIGNSILALPSWAVLLTSDNANQYFSRLLYCIGACIVEVSPTVLTEHTIMGLTNLHVEVGQQVKIHGGKYCLRHFLNTIPGGLLGSVASAVFKSTIKGDYLGLFQHEILHNIVVSLVRNRKRSGDGTGAHAFVEGLEDSLIDHHNTSYYHLCSIGILTISSEASTARFLQLMGTYHLELEYIDQMFRKEELESILQGLPTLKEALRLVLEEATPPKFISSQCAVLKLVLKSVTLSMEVLDTKFYDRTPMQLYGKRWDMLRIATQLLKLGVRTSSLKPQDFSLLSFTNICSALGNRTVSEEEARSLGKSFMSLAKEFAVLKYHVQSSRAYFSAIMCYLRCRVTDQSVIDSVLNCSWCASECLAVCHSQDIWADVIWLREIVSISSLMGDFTHCTSALMRDYVRLVAPLESFPNESVTSNALRISKVEEDLHTVCQTGWIEIQAICRYAPHRINELVARFKNTCMNLRAIWPHTCNIRMDLLYGITLGLSGRLSECQAVVCSGLQILHAAAEGQKEHKCMCVLESIACGHISYALICAHYSQQRANKCGLEPDKALKGDTYWWRESSSNLSAGLEKMESLQLATLNHKSFDVLFLTDILIQSAGLAGAQGFVTMEARFIKILEDLMASGALKNLSKMQENSIMQVGECMWLGDCEQYSTRVSCLATNSSTTATIASQLTGLIPERECKPLAHEWISAFHTIEDTLKTRKDAEGFYSRIQFHLLAARACFNQGLLLASLHHVEQALPLANGLHMKEYHEGQTNKLPCALTYAQWRARKEVISTLLLKSEIHECMDMPKRAQWALEKALEIVNCIHAPVYAIVINVARAQLFMKKGLRVEALEGIESAQRLLSSLQTVGVQEKAMICYLEAQVMFTRGLCCQASEGPSREVVLLFHGAKKQLLGAEPDGCLQWPCHRLHLQVEALIASCQHELDPLQAKIEPSSANCFTSIQDGFQHFGLDALSYIYAMSKLCHSPQDVVRHNSGAHGVFFGIRSSCRKSIVDLLEDVELAADSSSMDGLCCNNDGVPEEGRVKADLMDISSFQWALHSLSHSSIGSIAWLQVLLMCWNGFQEVPGKIRCISKDLFAGMAERGELHAASYFLFAGMNPGFQLQGLLRLQQHMETNRKELPPVQGLHKFKFRMKDFDVERVDEECRCIMDCLLKSFPPTSVLGITHHPWSKNIIVARYKFGSAPVIVMLPAVFGALNVSRDSSALDLQEILDTLLDILKKQEDMFDGQSNVSDDRDVLRLWWENRWQQECRLRDLIEVVNRQCLLEWEWLFSGEVDDGLVQTVLMEESREFLAQFVNDGGGSTKESLVLTELVRLVLLSANSLGIQQSKRAIQMLFDLVGIFPGTNFEELVVSMIERTWRVCSNTSFKEKKELSSTQTKLSDSRLLRKSARVVSMLDCQTPEPSLSRLRKPPRSTESRMASISQPNLQAGCPSVAHLPSVLCLDPTLQSFPWENCPCLGSHAYCRAPDLATVCALAEKCANLRPQNGHLRFPVVNLQSTFYVVDPEDNLPSLDGFDKQFQGIPSWKGLSGKIPSWKDMHEALNSHDMYVYLGHGSGEKTIPSKNLQEACCRSAGLIMGCNSARLWDCGHYEPCGRILYFLLAGCPSVIGNLWVVSDQDVNRYSQAILDSWKRSASGTDLDFLAVSAKAGRNSCKFRYLVGAAPVCYGVPLKALKFQTPVHILKAAGEVIDLTTE